MDKKWQYLFAIAAVVLLAAFWLSGQKKESESDNDQIFENLGKNYTINRTITLPHSGENVTLVLTSSSPGYKRYGIRGAETIEYGYGESKGGLQMQFITTAAHSIMSSPAIHMEATRADISAKQSSAALCLQKRLLSKNT